MFYLAGLGFLTAALLITIIMVGLFSTAEIRPHSVWIFAPLASSVGCLAIAIVFAVVDFIRT